MNMKQYFAKLLLDEMDKNDKIIFITADLGYKLWDDIKNKYPDRCIVMGASEQLAMGAAAGLAIEGKIPVVYSITNFLLYRPFEIIRNYINYEKLPVKMIGSGRDKDYSHDGFTHWAEDDKEVMSLFNNIETYHPDSNLHLEDVVSNVFNESLDSPSYINLRR